MHYSYCSYYEFLKHIDKMMNEARVEMVRIEEPIIIVGRSFQGDYARSHEYILEVQEELDNCGIKYKPYKVMGIYYDNPQEKPAGDLKSFQGVFVTEIEASMPASLERVSLQGKFLYVRLTGDIMKAIYDGYTALFKHIQDEHIQLKSPAGYQVSTIVDEVIVTEIYLEVA